METDAPDIWLERVSPDGAAITIFIVHFSPEIRASLVTGLKSLPPVRKEPRPVRWWQFWRGWTVDVMTS